MSKQSVESMLRSGVLGFVELPSGEAGKWAVPGYELDVVDGFFVPVQHVGLYRRVVDRYGHLVLGPITNWLWMSKLLMTAVSETLNMISEIESASTARDTKLFRERRVDILLENLKLVNKIGLSVGWLISLLEELDRTLRSSQSEEEAESKLQSVLAGFL